MIDLIALGLVAGWAFIGWRRGTILTLLSGAGLVAGYVGALLLYKPLGDLIVRSSSLGPMAAYPLGGLLGMLGVATVFSLLAHLVRVRKTRRLKDGFNPSPLDRAGGAALGALWALGVVVVLGWGATVVQGVTRQDLGIERSVAGGLSSAVMGDVVEFLARRFTGNSTLAATIAAFVVRPREALESINQLASDPRLRTLFGDSAVREALERGDVETLARHPIVVQLVRDPEFLRAARNLDLIDGLGANANQREITEQLAERIGPLVRAAERLSRDAEVQRMLRESRFGHGPEGGTVRDVLSDADFNTLVRRFLDEVRRG